jgi:hypothetical protein
VQKGGQEVGAYLGDPSQDLGSQLTQLDRENGVVMRGASNC